MEHTVEVLILGGSVLTSAGVAFGIVKGKLYNYISHGEHREICHQKSTEVYAKFDEFVKQQGEILRAIGRIEGKMDNFKQ